MRTSSRLIVIVTAALIACAPVARVAEPARTDAPRALIDLPNDPIQREHASTDPLRCTARATIPQLNDAFEADWSADSRYLALSRIVTIPSDTTITGYEEDQRIAVLDLATGAITDRGTGSEPKWSGSGAWLSYWPDEKTLWIVKRTSVLPTTVLHPTQPNIQWVGDELLFWDGREIRSWRDGKVSGVATLPAELQPRYPRDDAVFSPDGALFTLTRYANANTERYVGVTHTGETAPLADDGAFFTEWSPKGETLLMRTTTRMSLWDGKTRSVVTSRQSAPGTVHTWLADGRLALGTVAPTVPAGNAFDRFTVWDEGAATATLPNLLGIRAFSPDGAFFAGVTRTGLYSTQLELWRCGVSADTDLAGDPSVREREAKIEADARRFVRPTAAAITQYLQGSHTGIDIAAPNGTLIVADDAGVVSAVGVVQVGGRRVCVEHTGGLETCDYHTALPLVNIGDHVVRGQPIALMGLTGVTTGWHVHWEVRRNGLLVDPLKQ